MRPLHGPDIQIVAIDAVTPVGFYQVPKQVRPPVPATNYSYLHDILQGSVKDANITLNRKSAEPPGVGCVTTRVKSSNKAAVAS